MGNLWARAVPSRTIPNLTPFQPTLSHQPGIDRNSCNQICQQQLSTASADRGTGAGRAAAGARARARTGRTHFGLQLDCALAFCPHPLGQPLLLLVLLPLLGGLLLWCKAADLRLSIAPRPPKLRMQGLLLRLPLPLRHLQCGPVLPRRFHKQPQSSRCQCFIAF